MTVIKISGEIGFDYNSTMISDSLRAAKGDDIDIHIASPGGDVFDGIEIYNMIRDYKRDNPKAQIMMTLKGLGASMASYIMMAPADMRVAEDNAVFMVHNPWILAMGDYKEMGKQAEFLSGLASLMADAYVRVTGKKKTDVQAIMDEETWLFGDEIKAAGFVDDMIPSEDGGKKDEDGKKQALASARLKFGAMISDAQKRADAEANANKAAAMLSTLPGKSGSDKNTNPDAGEGDREEMEIKCFADVKAQLPEVYAEAEKTIGKKAVEDERGRVKALKELGAKGAKVGAVAELIDKTIEEGGTAESIALSVANLVMAAAESAGSIDANGTPSAETIVPAAWV